MQSQLLEFQQRDVALVAIGQGTGEEAAGFARKWGVEFPCLGDPKGRAYQAYGLTRGTWWSVLVRGFLTQPIETLGKIAEADMRGATLAAADVLRLGGSAVVGKGGVLRFLHRSESPADITTSQELLSALNAL